MIIRHKSIRVSVRLMEKGCCECNISLTTFQAQLSTPGLKKSVSNAPKYLILIAGRYGVNAYRLALYQTRVSRQLLVYQTMRPQVYLLNESIVLHSVLEVNQFQELTGRRHNKLHGMIPSEHDDQNEYVRIKL